MLNFLYLNKILYGKLSAIDSGLLKYCKTNNIKIVNVNQGYCRCSALVAAENAVITADSAIQNALQENGADVLKISNGNIVLDGYDYGFIGGAGAKLDNNTLAFFGNIENNPYFPGIYNFCRKYNVKIDIIGKEAPLTDIGGIVKIS
ncbi:MAG: hypothetical protein LUF33_09095 [Clostridiales bacterium]|nr:hypothetical protein [Clostridiales bacterium]